MKLFIANDHAGVQLKKALLSYIKNLSVDTEDLGCFIEESVDYPDYATLMAESIALQPDALGILICGSGIGMSIAVNRHPHIRAALCHNEEYAQLAKAHNNANVLVLGARFTDEAEAISILTAFLKTKFEGGRHQARLDKLGCDNK